MSTTQQPEALRIADLLEQCSINSLLSPFMEVANELRSQHARIEELETQLSAIGAIGAIGVEPLRKHVAETSNDILTMVDTPIIKRRIADARDAARYRWLRDNDWNADKDLGPVIRQQLTAIWDVKIDEAMVAQARNKKGIEQ